MVLSNKRRPDMRNTSKTILFMLLALWHLAFVQPTIAADSVTVEGLITPRDNEGMYVRNPAGQFEIEWTRDTRVALEVNTRLLGGIKEDGLHYKVHSSREVILFPLPKGPVTGVVEIRHKNHLERIIREAREENWIGERGLRLRFGEKLPQQFPTTADPRFVGLWNWKAKPRTLTIHGKSHEISMKKGGQTSALLFNVLGTKDCRPFINRARVTGQKKGEVIVAGEIHLQPIGDQAASDDPKLPRYLFIGDSISGNYDRGLRAALAGQFTLHHPPTN